MEKNRIAIYTAIFGDYDDLIAPEGEVLDCDFFCFTDNKNLKSDLYTIIYTPSVFTDKTRDARKIKTMPHLILPDYEYTLWIDSNITFESYDIRSLFEEFLCNHDIAFHSHRVRDCLYLEAKECIRRNLDQASTIVNQIVKYVYEGYPIHNGLVETGVIFRKNTEIVRKINEEWWGEIKNGTKRDQISINYVLWKSKENCFKIDENFSSNKNFSIKNHRMSKDNSVKEFISREELEKKNLDLENIIASQKFSKLKFCEKELQSSISELKKMRSSKFWKLRSKYLNLKKGIFSIK